MFSTVKSRNYESRYNDKFHYLDIMTVQGNDTVMQVSLLRYA